MRKAGHAVLEHVEGVVLDMNGSLSVVSKSAAVASSLVGVTK